jgi:alpha-beta hydrolase superfamily lysophospholipase
LQHIVDELDLPQMAMFAWDARGHGRSLEERDAGATLGTLEKDVDIFVRHVSSSYGIPVENIAVLGQSVGGVLVATWVHDFAPKIRCMVLATPAFKVKLYLEAVSSIHRELPCEFVCERMPGQHRQECPCH